MSCQIDELGAEPSRPGDDDEDDMRGQWSKPIVKSLNEDLIPVVQDLISDILETPEKYANPSTSKETLRGIIHNLVKIITKY